jgi:phage terminase large subunit
MEVLFPEKYYRIFRKPARYKVQHGGRGGGKSWDTAQDFVLEGAFHKYRYLCTREFQASIKDSVYRLICDVIERLGLRNNFYILNDSIKSVFGSEFIFKGLHQNISEVKSLEGIDRCWVEEADKLSKSSWDILIPTIRNEGSEIHITFNPEDERSATYQMFLGEKGPPPDSIVVEINYPDNPWFPEVLRKEMEYCRVNDPEMYDHIWGGKPKRYGQRCVFRNVYIEDFEEPPEDTQFFYGADFGFSVDPTALVRMFIKNINETTTELYITHEAYGHGVEIVDLPAFFRTVPDTDKWKIRADSERPDTISHLHNEGFDIEGAEKGKGSVEDGIQFLRSFSRIVIHPRCKGSADDFRNYRWKEDKTTGDILPIPLDKANHACDAARYALEPYVKRKVSCWDVIPDGELTFQSQ